MWNEPYLETCCRAALHRLTLVGPHGRPPGLTDQPCLRRLETMGLAIQRPDGHFTVTDPGRIQHRALVLRKTG